MHLCPALWMLHENYPQAEIHVVTTPVGHEVLKMLPCIKKVWEYRLPNPSPRWHKSLDLVKQLRKEHFDLLFNFSGSDRTLYFSFALGIKHRIAQTPSRWHVYNSILFPYWAPKQSESSGESVFELHRNMLASCGLKRFDDGQNPFHLQPPAGPEIENYLPKNSEIFIHCSLNTSSFLKEWSLQKWSDLFSKILREYPQVNILLSCSDKEREIRRVQELKKINPDSRIIALPPGLSIPQLSNILKRCKLHLGCDTGTVHLAYALGVPTLTLFRKDPNALAWIPVGENHIQLWGKCHCIEAVQKECKKNGISHCLEKISSEEFFQKFKSLFEKVKA